MVNVNRRLGKTFPSPEAHLLPRQISKIERLAILLTAFSL